MWKRIKDNELYLSYSSINGFRLLLTNYVTIWHAIFSKTQFIQCLKDSNNKFSKILESVMLQHASHMLLNPDDVRIVNVVNEGLYLKLTLTKKFKYDFRIVVKFTEGSKELFFQQITFPLLNAVCRLSSSQSELCSLLKEKDTEIIAYKSLNPTMTIPFHETTPTFDENEHEIKHKLHQDFFDYAEISSSLLSNTILVPEDKIIIHSENKIETNKLKQEIKIESDSETDERLLNICESTDTRDNKSEYVKMEPRSRVPPPRKKSKILNL